ncbi:MAG TPA: transcriptional repressor LexA [Streptosporangiaceae bacterium]|nr:transcriptional repressor LexA [Streptosporangiaceae bacterium]
MPRLAGRAGRELTPIQLAILDFVVEHTRRRGYPPTYQEIGGAVNLRSGSAVSYQADVLEEMGYLSRRPGCPRSIVVTERYQPRVSEQAAGERADDSTRMPLVGRIAAGGPILALEDIEDELLLPRSLVGYGDLIALRIRGDSMTGAGIHSGDIVVVRRQPRVEIGENVAAMIRDEVTGDLEATVKQYQVYDGHTWLIPRNPAYAPIPADSAIIIGKVAAVFRGGL